MYVSTDSEYSTAYKDIKMADSVNRLQFRVDFSLIPPVALSMLMGSWIIFMESHTDRFWFLIIILAPFYYLGAEILARKILVDSSGIVIRKFLRRAQMSWEDISYVDSLRSGRKVFLIIESNSTRPALLTNTLGQFPALVESIIQRLPPDKVSDSAIELVKNMPNKYGPMIQAWAVCLMLGAILVGKLMGYA